MDASSEPNYEDWKGLADFLGDEDGNGMETSNEPNDVDWDELSKTSRRNPSTYRNSRPKNPLSKTSRRSSSIYRSSIKT